MGRSKDSALLIRLPAEALERLHEAADLTGMNVSQWVRSRMASGLERLGVDNTSLLARPKRKGLNVRRYVYQDSGVYECRDGHHPKLLGVLDERGVCDAQTGLSASQVAKLYRRQCMKDGIDIEKLPERLYKFLALYPEKL